MRILPALLLLATALPATAEIETTGKDRDGLSLTLYNNDLALVRDHRSVRLERGENRLAFADVAARIRPETARLFGAATVLEQNFDFDLLTPRSLLEKYVGKKVNLVRIHPQTDQEREESGTLLSVSDGGVVFRIGDRIETGGADSPWRFVFNEVPENLRERPTLSMTVESEQSSELPLELAYLTGGIDWRADYVAALDEGNGKMDLTGWVTLTNRSGTAYPDAEVQLMAGDVHQERPAADTRRMAKVMMEAAAPLPREEGLFEYHLYTLGRPTTLADNQTKQVLLLQADGIPVTRHYRIRAPRYAQPGVDQELKAEVQLTFRNDRPTLGRPLPKGGMRFYTRDGDGRLQFIGENRIDHTPEGREVEQRVGNAFDITAKRRQTDARKLYGSERETAWRVEVFNAKAHDVTVELLEPMAGDWQIVEESLPHERADAATARWQLHVPAKGSTLLTYRVREK
ncbi:DUF4139 domain-containing protein [Endothiovibrio diazotrophicus]